jgi:glucosamine--fructose-6-phosphate aminotransferase (isomerizing)
VVFADRGDGRYDPYAEVVIPMPPSSPRLAMLAQVMAGHLFAYHAARAVDEGARFFTRLRASVVAEMLAGSPSARESREEALRETAERLHARRFESALGPAQAGDLLLLLSGAFGAAADAVVAALTEAVRELERPVDAIRHQAKIVTVGTSRTVERPAGPLFDSLEAAGVPLDEVPEAATEALRSVQPAVESVEGWARYRVEGLGEDGAPVESTRLVLEKRGGVSASLPSRAEGGAPLKGTKRGVVGTRRPFVGIGAKDGRSIAILPLVDARLRCTALALLHLRFREAMPVEEKVRVLGHRRLEEVVNGVTEADIPWSDALLDPIPPRDLFARSTETLVATLVARGKGTHPAG